MSFFSVTHRPSMRRASVWYQVGLGNRPSPRETHRDHVGNQLRRLDPRLHQLEEFLPESVWQELLKKPPVHRRPDLSSGSRWIANVFGENYRHAFRHFHEAKERRDLFHHLCFLLSATKFGRRTAQAIRSGEVLVWFQPELLRRVPSEGGKTIVAATFAELCLIVLDDMRRSPIDAAVSLVHEYRHLVSPLADHRQCSRDEQELLRHIAS